MNPALPSGTGGSGKMPKMGKMRVALIDDGGNYQSSINDDDGNYHLSMSKRTTILKIFMIDIIW